MNAQHEGLLERERILLIDINGNSDKNNEGKKQPEEELQQGPSVSLQEQSQAPQMNQHVQERTWRSRLIAGTRRSRHPGTVGLGGLMLAEQLAFRRVQRPAVP